MTVSSIEFDDMDQRLTWATITDAMWDGHKRPKASIADNFVYRDPDTLLSRAAWIDGLGAAVKSATVMPGNPGNGLPMIHGGVMLFEDQTGKLEALVDFHLVTKWKTAGDSLLGAKLLARPDSRNILIVGAGTVATNLIDAYASYFTDASFTIWNRTHAKAEALARDLSDHHKVTAHQDLESAVGAADIISSATMSTQPILQGKWLQPGQHVDLIGAYRPDMREADDDALRRARLFVDSRDTTIGHIGEIMLPLKTEAIKESDILADYYDLAAGADGRTSPDDITLFKNGGGAHLDLMTARAILAAWQSR